MYPEYAEINGKMYKIDTDYRTALKCFDVINNKKITDFERAIAVIYLLFDFVPEKDINLFLEKAKIFLEHNKNNKSKKERKKDLDLKQDISYINASFMSTYHKDITKEKMHFWEFIDLIEGLTDDCVLSRIRDIRNCDLKEIKDEKKRKEIKEAKEFFKLEEEKKEPTLKQKESMNKLYKIIGIGGIKK